ncbi:MAG: hypothetical protein ACXVX9_10045 [Mycobacteriaceae bacterium]
MTDTCTASGRATTVAELARGPNQGIDQWVNGSDRSLGVEP